MTQKCTLSDPDKVKLSEWIARQNYHGQQFPEVNCEVIDRIRSESERRPGERADALLEYFIRSTKQLGKNLPLSKEMGRNKGDGELDYMMALTSSLSQGEVEYLRDFLVEKGLMSVSTLNNGHTDETKYRISMSGYSYFEEIKKSSVILGQGFIAMWFSECTENLRVSIKKAIEKAGYNYFIVDEKNHADKIDDEIVSQIRRSRFMVADFTCGAEGARGGVYYEAGFARGLSIPVISTCRKDMMDKVHFDTRQYNHLLWEKEELAEFTKNLSSRITAIIGDGPHRSNREESR